MSNHRRYLESLKWFYMEIETEKTSQFHQELLLPFSYGADRFDEFD